MDADNNPLSAYTAEREARLAEQAKNVAAEQEKVTAAAQADIEKFKEERARKAQKTREENRIHQEQTEENIKAALNEGNNSWERIASLVDLKTKTEGKDTGRLRKILLDLKASPPAGAGGGGAEKQ
eukprot:TRINITY_DN1001_c0_g1_i1.p3 TRINITY_DN1001_c0_g1~~TRINITY_DN1001_c0_g1_i1.p3  ORF type:complete len:126 (+),score=45.42 TRINITY_DN1001_c0_g1_i1:414-791(+)